MIIFCTTIVFLAGICFFFARLETADNIYSSRKNERMVGEILLTNGIVFETQYSIKKLFGNEQREILVDYYIPSLNVIIEYNGAQHYRPVCFAGMSKELADQQFSEQQDRDRYLQTFCDQNGIRLIWIDGRKYANHKLTEYVSSSILPMLETASVKSRPELGHEVHSDAQRQKRVNAFAPHELPVEDQFDFDRVLITSVKARASHHEEIMAKISDPKLFERCLQQLTNSSLSVEWLRTENIILCRTDIKEDPFLSLEEGKLFFEAFKKACDEKGIKSHLGSYSDNLYVNRVSFETYRDHLMKD
jgi:hypothetical protein